MQTLGSLWLFLKNYSLTCISSTNFNEILILAGGYIFINVIAIVMNERVNGSKGTLTKLVFQETFWITLLNILLWIGESYVASCEGISKNITDNLVTYGAYIFLAQLFLFIILPILSIVANKNSFFKKILYAFTSIVNFIHSKKLLIDDDLFKEKDKDNDNDNGNDRNYEKTSTIIMSSSMKDNKRRGK